jgi:hypothetical protein
MRSPPGNESTRRATGRREELTNRRNYNPPSVWQAESLDGLLKAKRVLRSLQAPSAEVFWNFERAIAQIDMEIERRSSL